MQADLGGIIGIEGPGWPRINSAADNGLGLNYLPDPIYREFTDEERFGPLERSQDGRVWPRPTQCLMEEVKNSPSFHCFVFFAILTPNSATRATPASPASTCP